MEEEEFKGIRPDLPFCLTKSQYQGMKKMDPHIEEEFDSFTKKANVKKLHKLILSVNNTPLEMFRKEENLCLKCRNEEIDIVFLPCGHASMCHLCCDDLFNDELYCNICKELIENISYFKEEEEKEQKEKPNSQQISKKATFEESVQNPIAFNNPVSFEQIKTYEEIEEKFKGNSNNLFNEKEEFKKEETVEHMEASLGRRVSHPHMNTLTKTLEKKMKVNREKNIIFSDSIGGNVFKDFEKRTESDFSQQEDDIELEYLGI